MSLHQYIGARYVPKFYENSRGTADWVAGVIYEPLTIVMYNNNSYTSKKTVPASVGNPSANPSYWVATGSYNQQIADLSDRVDLVEADLSAAEDNIQDIKLPKTVIVTDSYGSGSLPGVTKNFCQVFAETAGYTLRTDFDYQQLDGAGFVSDGRLFMTPLATLYGRLSGNMAPDKIDRVIFAGGCNDNTLSVSVIKGGMATTIAQAKADFPNAKIYVAEIGNVNSDRNRLFETSGAAYSQCGAFGAYYIPNLEWVMLNDSYFQTDGIHPNQAGSTAIGIALAEALESGYTDRPTEATGSMTLDSTTWLNTSQNINYKIIPDNGTITLITTGDFRLRCTQQTIPAGNLKIGSFNDNYIQGAVGGPIRFPLFAIIGTTGGNTEKYLQACIVNKDLYLIVPVAIANMTDLILYRSATTFPRHLT